MVVQRTQSNEYTEGTDPYINWLCVRVKITPLKRRYMEMARVMHGIRFVPRIFATDENRANDGLQLRVEYIEKYGMKGSACDRGRCTMLELLVGLSKRISFLMGTENDPHQTATYFWKMIENLGLMKYDDEHWYSCNGEFHVTEAMDRIMNYSYSADGTGGLFPLKYVKGDQRKREIWYQMQNWLNENAENLLG